jgi:integrase
MPRSPSRKVVLFRRGKTWWFRVTVPRDVAARLKTPAGLGLKLDAHNRWRDSLKTESKREAEELASAIQTQVDLAQRSALNLKAFSLLTGNQGRVPRTIDELLAELQDRERKRVAVWRSCSNPIDARNQHALHPRTAMRYGLMRAYLKEFLQQKHPGESLLVSNVGLDSDSRPHLVALKEWILNERRLQRITYKQLRAYFSEAWQSLAVPSRYADVNPWKDPRLRPPRAGEAPRAILSTQQRGLVAALPSSWKNNALKILLLTGHRVSELCWLQRGDVDTAAKTVRWLNSKTGRYETLPATAAELAAIEDQTKSHTSLWVFPRKDGSQCDGHYLETKLGRALSAALESCPLPRVSPQSLRRTWQTVAARLAKSDPHAVKDLMMHRSLDQQLTYIQADVEALRETAQTVQGWLVNGYAPLSASQQRK